MVEGGNYTERVGVHTLRHNQAWWQTKTQLPWSPSSAPKRISTATANTSHGPDLAAAVVRQGPLVPRQCSNDTAVADGIWLPGHSFCSLQLDDDSLGYPGVARFQCNLG